MGGAPLTRRFDDLLRGQSESPSCTCHFSNSLSRKYLVCRGAMFWCKWQSWILSLPRTPVFNNKHLSPFWHKRSLGPKDYISACLSCCTDPMGLRWKVVGNLFLVVGFHKMYFPDILFCHITQCQLNYHIM